MVAGRPARAGGVVAARPLIVTNRATTNGRAGGNFARLRRSYVHRGTTSGRAGGNFARLRRASAAPAPTPAVAAGGKRRRAAKAAHRVRAGKAGGGTVGTASKGKVLGYEIVAYIWPAAAHRFREGHGGAHLFFPLLLPFFFMVRTQTIAVNYKSYDDSALLVYGGNLNTRFYGNANYPAPPVAAAAFKTQLEELQTAVEQMQTGLRSATLDRDRSRQLLEASLRQLSDYAVTATPDRPDQWADAGFALTKADSQPRPASQPITGLALLDDDSANALRASVTRQAGVYGYLWRVYPRNTPTTMLATGFAYRVCVSREPVISIDNLLSGEAYCVEAAAWNDSGPLQWSQPVSRIVQ